MKAAKERGKGPNLKTKELKKALETASLSKEGIDYAVEQVESVIAKFSLKENPLFNKVLSVFRDVAKFVGLAKEGDHSWSGEAPKSGYEKVQRGVAKASAEQISVEKSIDFTFAINPESKFQKKYTVESTGTDGQPKRVKVDDATESVMDDQLIAWFAKNKWKNEDGFVYELNEKGQIKKDASGKPVKADPETVKSRISSEETGFKKFAQDANESLQMSVHSQDYVASKQEVITPKAGQSMSGG